MLHNSERLKKFNLPPISIVDEQGNLHDCKNPLNDKYGLIVDYAIEQNMTEKNRVNLINQYVKIDVLDKNGVLIPIDDCSTEFEVWG